MTRRRLRLPAAIALLAVAAPVLANQTGSAPSDSPVTTLRNNARQFGTAVKHGSAEVGQRVAHGARDVGHQFSAGMHQVGHGVHRWWDGVRSSVARA